MKDIAAFAEQVFQNTTSFNGFDEADNAKLGLVKGITIPWAQELAQVYEDVLRGSEDTMKHLEGVARADHQQAFAGWFENLISGDQGASFWSETCLIGMYHAAASVENRYVVAMSERVEESFLERCLKAFEPEEATTVYLAFKRVFNVALAVMIDSYHHAIMRGLEGIGIGPRLVARIRGTGIRKMIDESRSVLPLISWSEALSVRIEIIDQQHKKLIDLLNALHDSSVQGRGNETLKQILGDLVTYTVEHFATEEKLFDEYGYPGTAAHKEAHKALTDQVAAFNDEFQAGKATLSGDLFKFLRTWLNGHIRGTDKLYVPFLLEKGVH